MARRDRLPGMSRPDAVQRTARGSLLASVVLMIASFAAGLPMAAALVVLAFVDRE